MLNLRKYAVYTTQKKTSHSDTFSWWSWGCDRTNQWVHLEIDWLVIGAVHLKARRAARIDPSPNGLSFQSHADRGLTLIGERHAIIYVLGECSAVKCAYSRENGFERRQTDRYQITREEKQEHVWVDSILKCFKIAIL